MFNNLTEVKSWIANNYNDTNKILEQTKAILEPISSKEQILLLLNSLLEDPQMLLEISKRSYTHINGFDKIVLIESKSPEYKIRLHIWWPEYKISHIEHIHNHPWDFSSRVLTGELTFQTFSSQNGTGESLHYYRTFPPNPGESGHILRKMGTQTLQLMFDTTITSGSFYTMSKKIKHRVLKSSQSVNSTLIFQGPFGEGISDLFCDKEFSGSEKVPLDFFDVDILKYKIRKYITFLLAS
ncbi:hypothetical protein QNH46_09030 [Paenibacillus woosongensis]|uniref:Uncharacterized protein n=1 Tax=Paenibacillus woosongensis TaxID=307580 RepID=A0AA95L225_9BACL|nr:hypothetical protein [Paenibacillus woosongensis]WHX50769.1 hypothetical protein QNH46_09030 [Paenibacillus woosongensis]